MRPLGELAGGRTLGALQAVEQGLQSLRGVWEHLGKVRDFEAAVGELRNALGQDPEGMARHLLAGFGGH